MNFIIAISILGIGVIAGFINTVAGGGSLLTLPVLIFLGLPTVIANATNRVAIVVQNICAVAGFKSQGISEGKYSIYLGISAIFGALVGARLALVIDDRNFKKILALIMILACAWIICKPLARKKEMVITPKRNALGIALFFFVGIYGGFIQSGVGFIIIGSLTIVNGFDLVRANSIKVRVVLIYTLAALSLFIYHGKVHWLYGITLSVGNGIGGWLGSRWGVKKGEKWIRKVMITAILFMALKLVFF